MKIVKICAVICEFNPFHNGHEYILYNLREKGFTHIIAVMSGNFVQRACPALFPKEARTKAALLCGADLVIELPLPYATATAERFAFGGCEIIKALGCVDAVAFGAETANVKELINIAETLTSETFSEKIKKYLEQGLSFAESREKSLNEFSHLNSEIVKTPNNILAIEYIKHLLKSDIDIIPITRKFSEHDKEGEINGFSSASYIRENWGANFLNNVMPKKSLEIFKEYENQGEILSNQKIFDLIMLSHLRNLDLDDIKNLPYISEGIENKFYNAIKSSVSSDELFSKVKSKRYSHSRIRRIALSGFLNITKDFINIQPPYAHILGFNQKGSEILTIAKKTSAIPISHSLKKLSEIDSVCSKFSVLESNSTNQYNLLLDKIKPCGTDYTNRIIKI